jgi:hypothetical protein
MLLLFTKATFRDDAPAAAAARLAAHKFSGTEVPA